MKGTYEDTAIAMTSNRTEMGEKGNAGLTGDDALPKRARRRGRPSKKDVEASPGPHPTPKMKVYLFGGLRVYIGSEKIADEKWSKAKAKVLFGHLVTRFGREVGREILCDAMWPGFDEYRATDNLYVLWSSLKRTIANEYGECPYIVCNRSLYKIDPALVDSDVRQFDELTRKVLFGKPTARSMRRIFVKLDQLYAGDLLAGVKCDDYLSGLRDRYRDTYVDSLIAASSTYVDSRDFGEALWFARKAMSIDSKREDVYRALMIAQGLSGQRVSAMQTFFKCKEYLDSELGLPLSKKTIDIYQKLIKDDLGPSS